MPSSVLYPFGSGYATKYAASILKNHDFLLTDHPSPDVSHLLLDLPSVSSEVLDQILQQLPNSIRIIGGNLPEDILQNYSCFSLLQDEAFLHQNAAITAECAVSIAMQNLSKTIHDSSFLIIGWGRIGKHLAACLMAWGAAVTVCSHTIIHRAEAASFGCRVIPYIDFSQEDYDVIFNTAPFLSLSESAVKQSHAVKIDLASSTGMEGSDIIYAKALPSKMAPISTGKLIADTILREERL